MDRVETYDGGFEVKSECKENYWLVTVSCHGIQISQLPVYGLSNVNNVGLAIINAYLKGTIEMGKIALNRHEDEDEDDEDL